MFRDKPDRFFCRHPIEMIEAREIYRARVAAERALEAEIEVNIKVTHGEFAQRSVNRLAISAAGEVGFRNCAPATAHFENCDDMIGVVFGFKVEDQRRKTQHAQCGRGKDSTVEAGCRVIMQNLARRSRVVLKIVRQFVEKPLNPGRRLKGAQRAQLGP